MNKRRLVAGSVALGLALAFAPPAHGDDKEDCISGYEQSQRHTLDGKLRTARAQLLLCSRPVCPKVTMNDCAKWLAALEPKVPTVLLSARDPAGKDIESMRFYVDGEVISERLDGRPIDVDPGAHTFRYESGSLVIEERVVVMEGEKNRRVSVDFAKAPGAAPTTAPPPRPQPPPPKESSTSIPTASWVLGGVAVASLAMFAGFAVTGKSGEGCVPNCSRGQVDDFRRDYLIADIALVIGLATGGIAVYMALTNHPRAAATTSAR